MNHLQRISAFAWQKPGLTITAFVFVVILFLILWARARDPFQRIYFSHSLENSRTLNGVVVMSKPKAERPIAIYIYNSREQLRSVGLRLRQLAETGVAAVAIDYDKHRQEVFDLQFEALLDFIREQDWGRDREVAWIGYGLGVERMLQYAAEANGADPAVIVAIAGGGLSEDTIEGWSLPPTEYLFIHGERDNVNPVNLTELLAEHLVDTGAVVNLITLPGMGSRFNPEQDIVFRTVAEFLAKHFTLKGTRNASSRFTGNLSLLVAFVAGGIIFLLISVGSLKILICRDLKSTSRHLLGLNTLLTVIIAAALIQTGTKLTVPLLFVSERSISIARATIVPERMQIAFDYLASDPGWEGTRLRYLLQHVKLAELQKTRFYPTMDDEKYFAYVLSPRITSAGPTEWRWRRTLWENFAPRVRREDNPLDAAVIVGRFLRERVGIDTDLPHRIGVETSWESGSTDRLGSEETYVAAMRAVGIASRIGNDGTAELWTGHGWFPAPVPFLKLGLTHEGYRQTNP